MASEEITHILTSPDKGVAKAEDELTKLSRLIMQDTNVTLGRWSSLMDRFLDDPYNHVPQNTKDRSSMRGNLNKEFKRPTMSWKVFLKFLRFLGPVKIRFEVHLVWSNKRTTIHGLNIAPRCSPQPEDIAGFDDLVPPPTEESAALEKRTDLPAIEDPGFIAFVKSLSE